MKEISFYPLDFKVLYLLAGRPNLNVISYKALPEAIVSKYLHVTKA